VEVLNSAARDPADRTTRTVADLLRARRGDLTAAELRVAQALLSDYPAAGLQPVSALARCAGVSSPSVLRLVAKLGLAGYGDLQSRLRDELSARAAGPAARLPALGPAENLSPLLGRYADFVGRAVLDSLGRAEPVEVERAVRLLADPQRRILLAGGRVSTTLAEYLGRRLERVRSGVRVVPPERTQRAGALLDVEEGTVVVLFDFRRYESELLHFGRAAAAAGATPVLFTDPCLSPLAGSAAVLLTSAVEGPAPFLTLAPALALAEALVLATIDALGATVRDRLERFDAADGLLRP
jgi:DNA-binding MurR/RpiR family transcriptional regulator